MAWYTNDLSEGTIYIDGTGAMNYIASGSINAGQAVSVCGNNQVKVTTSNPSECDGIGIASIGSTDGNRISVYGYGNLVQCCTASDYAVNIPLYATSDGILTSTKGNSKKIVGYTFKVPILGASGVNYVGYVLLV